MVHSTRWTAWGVLDELDRPTTAANGICLIYPTDEYKWIQQGEVVNGLVKIEKISEFYEKGKIICEIRYGVKGKKKHKRPIAFG